MCSRPKIPKSPTVTQIPQPPEPEKTATQVQRSLERRQQSSAQRQSVLQRYDLPLPPNFRLPQ